MVFRIESLVVVENLLFYAGNTFGEQKLILWVCIGGHSYIITVRMHM